MSRENVDKRTEKLRDEVKMLKWNFEGFVIVIFESSDIQVVIPVITGTQ